MWAKHWWPVTCRMGKLLKIVLLLAMVALGLWGAAVGVCLVGLVVAARTFGPDIGQLTRPLLFEYSETTAIARAALHPDETTEGSKLVSTARLLP